MSDKEQMEAGKVVKVGVAQLDNPTPMWAKNIFRTVSFITGVWALVQHMDFGLKPDLIADINEWCIAIVPVMHFAIKFFGWDYKENPTN